MPPEVRKNGARPPRILIVDDDAGQRSLLDSFLRGQGFETVPVSSGELALETLRSVNRLLLDMNDAGMFVTVLYGVLDGPTSTFTFARAGHESPLLVDAHGKADSTIATAWWCSGSTYRGTVAHELGHTWGLPHPDVFTKGFRCADSTAYTIMHTPMYVIRAIFQRGGT